MRFSSEETAAEQSQPMAVSAFFSPAQLEAFQAKLHESTIHNNTFNVTKDDRGRPARIETLRTDSITDEVLLHAHNATSSGATSSRGLSPIPFQRPRTFLERVSHHQRELRCAGKDAAQSAPSVEINGDELIMADVASVAYFGAKVHITNDEHTRQRVASSVDFLKEHLDGGGVVYGVNTGFGGSATTRSADLVNTQRGLVQLLNSGVILTPEDRKSEVLSSLNKHDMSRPAVRGSMLVRANCLLRGHSAVRLAVIDTLVSLLNLDFIPVVPLRGSISASGDLSPLSYIAGALTGSPDILVDCLLKDGSREIMTSDKAMALAGLTPIVMGPKEGLGMLNGTSVSCAIACLALHETQYLALAAQVLTGMCTEAMGGCADNYHPFISRIRPHPGQVESAANIYRQISGSRLVSGKTGAAGELYQDRYALRTASQWIGPYLEDLSLSIDQLTIELNSTTDNPLVDPTTKTVHNGGNFQAVAVTSAVEKARLALQMIGKLLFAQCTEMINPMMNNILPPNLCFDDPSTSFTFKGVDINMAAYMGELAFLANPVSSHVQSAEMHNQALNSLALVSARFTLDAVEVVSLMAAAYLYAACQALDLHALFKESHNLILINARSAFDAHFPLQSAFNNDNLAAEACWTSVTSAIYSGLIEFKIKNRLDRARLTAETTILPLTKALLAINPTNTSSFASLSTWLPTLTTIIAESLLTVRQQFASTTPGPTTLQYLAPGSARMYTFIREKLGVPLHRGLIEHPDFPDAELQGIKLADRDLDKKTVGSRIGVIYKAIREGGRSGFGEVCLSCLS